MNRLLKQLWRLKSIESVTSETSLRRCLGVLDLIVIGVGSMVGSGIYIMTGTAAKTQAGGKSRFYSIGPMFKVINKK